MNADTHPQAAPAVPAKRVVINWRPGMLAQIAGNFFKVHSVNSRGDRVTMKAISQQEYEAILRAHGRFAEKSTGQDHPDSKAEPDKL